MEPTALLTVPSSDSTNSAAVSNRRMMRLSEKMNMVKQRRNGTLSPTSIDQQQQQTQTTSSVSSPLSSATSPTYSVQKKNNRPFSGHASSNRDPVPTQEEEENEGKYEDAEEEDEQDRYSEYSNRTNPNRVGMISPLPDTEGAHFREQDGSNMEEMDRIESERFDRNNLDQPSGSLFMTPSKSLEDVAEERGPEEKKEEDPVSERRGPAQRHRTPGGAAAKLMLLGPHTSCESDVTPRPSPDSSTGSEKQNLLQAALDQARRAAKTQFNVGPRSGSRSNNDACKDEEPLDIVAYRAKLIQDSPHLFDRSQVFYPSADAAVEAMKTPRSYAPCDAQSVYTHASVNLPYTASDGHSVAASVTSAFQVTDGDEGNTFESLSRKDVGDEVLPARTRVLVESMADEMQDPNHTLAQLLQTIGSADEGQVPDLGQTVRRKNACGALQVLTAQPSNRIPLAWTVGVLPALTSVLSDSGTEGLHEAYPEKRHRREFEVARDRAITCLVNLSIPKENRIPVFHSPDLVHWLVAMILEGKGGPRKGACAVMAYLAKTPDNRLLMVQVPRLIEALTKVLKPRPPRLEYQDDKTSPDYDDEDNLTEDENTATSGSTGDNTGQDTRTVGSDERSRHVPADLSKPAKLRNISSSYSNQTGDTQRLAGARSPIELKGYDQTADDLLREARTYAFAALSNLAKEKDNAFHFARDTPLIKTMSEIARLHDSPSHEHAVRFLATLTRHRLNSKILVFRRRSVVPAIVDATASPSASSRLFACFGLQNLSQDKSCRQELAIAENLLVSLCERARGATEQEEERLAALSAIKNLTDEPANLIPMSNTTDCIATLMHLAHGRQEGVTPLMQYRACDALATLSHWLRKIATSGQALTDAKMGKAPNSKELFVPSLRVVTVNQWQ